MTVHNWPMNPIAIQIGAAARAMGVPPKTLRYYEDLGLVRPDRTESGYRLYGSEELERIQFILRAKQLGFTLNEISDVMALREDDMEPCDHVASLIESRLAEIETRIRNLADLKIELETVRDSNTSASAGPCTGTICHLIEDDPTQSR